MESTFRQKSRINKALHALVLELEIAAELPVSSYVNSRLIDGDGWGEVPALIASTEREERYGHGDGYGYGDWESNGYGDGDGGYMDFGNGTGDGYGNSPNGLLEEHLGARLTLGNCMSREALHNAGLALELATGALTSAKDF